MDDIKTIDINDFSVTFYGGPEGFLNECRVIIALYSKAGATVGFIKFFNEGVKIKNDGFDKNKLFYLNLPVSFYLNIMESLRSKRPMQLMFDGKVGMLLENKYPPLPGKGINLN
jgi:hypothetical protein